MQSRRDRSTRYLGSLISLLYAATNPYAVHDNIATSGSCRTHDRCAPWRHATGSIDASLCWMQR